jgi:hypothetical protein
MRLDDDHRFLFSRWGDPHKSGMEHIRMLVEDRFAGNREQRAVDGLYPLGLTPAKPDAVALVQVADVTHAVSP